MDDAALGTLRAAAGAALDIGLAGMAGALATLVLLRDASSPWAARRLRRCRTLFGAAGWLALLASVAWLGVAAISMADDTPGDVWPTVVTIVTATAFGRAWAVATLALACALALARARRLRIVPLRTLALLLVATALGHAGTGHAMASGLDWRLPALAVHLLAMGLWAGAVFAAVVVTAGGPPDPLDAVRYARRLSTLATAALAGVALTGAAIAWHQLGGTLAPLNPAAASAWGFTLDAKLALVLGAVALGGFNRVAVLRGLPAAWPPFVRVLRVEALVLLAVLAAAAWLANGEPPAL